jgi:hypothetical protein
MAKDGTSRGGARIGAGQKKKPLADKILEGNPGRRKLMVMEFTDAAELEGESMPPPRDYLAAKQKNGKQHWRWKYTKKHGSGLRNAGVFTLSLRSL